MVHTFGSSKMISKKKFAQLDDQEAPRYLLILYIHINMFPCPTKSTILSINITERFSWAFCLGSGGIKLFHLQSLSDVPWRRMPKRDKHKPRPSLSKSLTLCGFYLSQNISSADQRKPFHA